MKKKPTLAVLFGGNSPEYSVSLQSAYAVLTNLDGEKYHILPLGITQTGRWYLYSGAYEHIATDTWAEAFGPPHPCGGLPGPGGSRAAGPLPPQEPGDSPGLRPAHSPRGQRGGRHRPGPLPAGGDPRGRLRHPGLRPVHGQGPGPQAGQAGRGGRPPLPGAPGLGGAPSGPRTSPSRRGIPCSSSR